MSNSEGKYTSNFGIMQHPAPKSCRNLVISILRFHVYCDMGLLTIMLLQGMV